MKSVTHSGTGRIARLTMSLYESGDSIGKVSLEKIYDTGENISAQNKLSLEDIAFLCCRGGWPRSIFMDKEIVLEQAFDYYDSVVESE